MLKVLAYVDEFGAGGRTPEQEYAEIKHELELTLGCFVEFQPDVPVSDLQDKSFDIYIVDFGGICHDYDNKGAIDLCRGLRAAAENHPGSLFIIESSFTYSWYHSIIDREIDGELDNIMGFGFEYEDKIRAWFGLPEPKFSCYAEMVDRGGV